MDESEHESLISVVIPTYNRPEFLEGAIETATEQTYGNIEVIVVDDGSEEDYAADIVRRHGDCVDLVEHESNKGLSAARNTGIKSASGEYIAFLDDDDRWHREKITRQVAALENDPDAGIATCLVEAVTPDGEIVHCESTAPSGDCSRELLRGNQIGTPSRVLVRRSCLKDVGTFDESLPTKQDWDLYIRICQNWRVVAVEDHLCFRTVHESMSSDPSAAERDKFSILQKHEDKIRESGEWTNAKSEVHERVGRAYLQSGQLSTARSHLFISLRKPSMRRTVLFVLSLTTHAAVETVTNLKRKVISYFRSCPRDIPVVD